GEAMAPPYCLSIAAWKDGYYSGRIGSTFHFEETDGTRWLPWNPEVKITLKKIINPVPMYASQAHIWMLPGAAVNGTAAKFDLVQCDWLPPFGKGTVPDLVFTVEEAIRIDDWRGSTKLRLGFTNPQDGIIDLDVEPIGKEKSSLLLPQEAPADGYKKEIVIVSGYPTPEPESPEIRVSQMDGDEDWGLIFRVRTKVDESGKIISACYGKMNRGPGIGKTKDGSLYIKFRYHFNPEPNSRALEFDTKKNLLKAEGRLKWVRVVDP
ncbi:MAG: hypothetical protein KDC54_11610, partial [Lewinella sp.]|nr:hypothetical protein [Lewinella sp.]